MENIMYVISLFLYVYVYMSIICVSSVSVRLVLPRGTDFALFLIPIEYFRGSTNALAVTANMIYTANNMMIYTNIL